MKTEKTLEKFGEVINYFIEHKANEENSDFYENVNKLINIKAELHQANEADTSYDKCHIQNVSVSLLNLIQLQADIYTEREAKAYESAAHREAYENNIKANTVEQILLMIKSNER